MVRNPNGSRNISFARKRNAKPSPYLSSMRVVMSSMRAVCSSSVNRLTLRRLVHFPHRTSSPSLPMSQPAPPQEQVSLVGFVCVLPCGNFFFPFPIIEGFGAFRYVPVSSRCRISRFISSRLFIFPSWISHASASQVGGKL